MPGEDSTPAAAQVVVREVKHFEGRGEELDQLFDRPFIQFITVKANLLDFFGLGRL